MIPSKNLFVIGTFPVKKGNLNGFLDASTIWINKPHVANKRLSGTKILHIETAGATDTVNQILSTVNSSQSSKEAHSVGLEVDLKESNEMFVVIIRQLFPKQRNVFPVLQEAVVFG